MCQTHHVIDWPYIHGSSCLADGYGDWNRHHPVGPCGSQEDCVFIQNFSWINGTKLINQTLQRLIIHANGTYRMFFAHGCSEVYTTSCHSWSIERPHQRRPHCGVPRQVRQLRTSYVSSFWVCDFGSRVDVMYTLYRMNTKKDPLPHPLPLPPRGNFCWYFSSACTFLYKILYNC